MQILIAEDEAIIAESLFQVLLDLGHSPLEPVNSFTEVKDMLQNNTPDLAIVDIHIGEQFSGFKVAEALNKINIPFIFLTALYDKETIEKAKSFNPSAYLVKPFNKENLFATIELAENQVKQKPIEKNFPNFFIKDGVKAISIDEMEIIYIKIEGKYAYLFLQQNKKYTLRISLHEILLQLSFPSIIQVHKSFAVNIHCITLIKYHEILVDSTIIPVGRTFRTQLLKKVQLGKVALGGRE
jgi:DNA-binding LytR/AlgR family response regulator